MDAMVRNAAGCKEVTVFGTPYERGVQYGRACRAEIRRSVQCYERLFMESKKLSWQEAQQLAMQYIPAICEASEDYIEEMRGIAEGAEMVFEDILVINARSGLLCAPLARKETQECTAFSLIPPATAEGAVLAGQNWDFVRAHRENVVILRVVPSDGKPGILMFPEAGLIGAMGMNDAGIGLTLNALSTTERGNGLPLHIRMRQILEQRTMETAYAKTVSGGQPAPANLIITHKDGIALGVELDPAGIDVLQPEGGVIIHSNHFIGRKFATRTHASNANTYVRFQRMQTLMSGKTGLTAADAKAVLCDHCGYPFSVCKHTVPEEVVPEMKQGATNFSLVMDLIHGTAEFAYGNPCQSSFVTLRVNEE